MKMHLGPALKGLAVLPQRTRGLQPKGCCTAACITGNRCTQATPVEIEGQLANTPV
jgi:hypothetical protein